MFLNKGKSFLGLKGYIVLHNDNDCIIGNLVATPEEAYRKHLGLMFPKDYRVVQVQIIDEPEAHLCFCKKNTCCCS